MEENDEYIIEQHRMYKQFEEARRQASVQPQPMLVEIKDGLESEDDQYLRAQEESLRYWEAKKNGTYHEPILIDEGDDGDLLLAMKLQAEEEAAEAARKDAERKSLEDEDRELARRLQEQEQNEVEAQRKAADQDALLAKTFLAEEEEKLKRERERREWEETLNLIRSEAKSEADIELARLLREKEELEDRLRKAEGGDGDPIVLSLAECEYPEFWQDQKMPFQSFDVAKGSVEWTQIANHFQKDLKVNIQRIERIQNKNLWMWYWLKRNEIKKKNKNNANEQMVFHGSRNNAYDTILKSGFDHRVANMGGAIGAGVYFGVTSAISNGYLPGNRDKKMLYCRITLGNIGQGQAGLRRPPQKRDGSLYDSVGTPGSMYVIFDNYQAYPEYVIHFS